MISIRECDAAAIRWVADHISEADELEILTVSGVDVHKGIAWGAEVSTDSFAIHPMLNGVAGDPVALFGVVDDSERSPGMAVVWMVTTPMLPSTSRDIIKTALQWFEAWKSRFPGGLHNLVDVRNERHVRWLKKMGAEFNGSGKIIRNQKFAYFTINAGAVN